MHSISSTVFEDDIKFLLSFERRCSVSGILRLRIGAFSCVTWRPLSCLGEVSPRAFSVCRHQRPYNHHWYTKLKLLAFRMAGRLTVVHAAPSRPRTSSMPFTLPDGPAKPPQRGRIHRSSHVLLLFLLLHALVVLLQPHAALSQSASSSPTPATLCPDTSWFYYTDVDFTEGHDSCYKISGTSDSWTMARNACPYGGHLITFAGTSKSSGLFYSVYSNLGSTISANAAWVGCSQDAGATSTTSGWSWVDGTSNANLNVGAGALLLLLSAS